MTRETTITCDRCNEEFLMNKQCNHHAGEEKEGMVLVWVSCKNCGLLMGGYRKKCTNTRCKEGQIQFGQVGYLLCLECEGKGHLDE